MRKALNLKHIRERSFLINGLTAKWGIGENRVPPIWDVNLIGYWDARDLPNGAVSTIANRATLATKAPDLIVKGATMADGTLQFDGVDDEAETPAFLLSNRFTVFWDADWSGAKYSSAGIVHMGGLYILNHSASNSLTCRVKKAGSFSPIPNANVGISTAGKYYSKSGAASNFRGVIGDGASAGALLIGCGYTQPNTVFTQMGLRQLLIFNKELSQAEVNEVLTAMFPV